MGETKEQTGYPSKDRPWLKYYSEEAVKGEIPDISIFDYMYSNNKDFKKSIAIRYLGTKINYNTLFTKIFETAKALTAAGCKKGDIVTIALPSIPEAVYLVYACNFLGLVANMIHPLAGESETIFFLNEVKSDVFIMFSGTYEIVGKSLEKTGVKTSVVVSPVESCNPAMKLLYRAKNKAKYENALSWNEFITAGKKVEITKAQASPDDAAVISHTGGTTGIPKGVVLSNRNLVSEIWQIGATMQGGRGTAMLVVLPPFINYNLTNSILEPLTLGITIVMIPKYEPGKIGEYLKKYRPQHINSIPPYWEELINSKETEKLDLSFFINAFYGGEKMPDDKVSKVNEILRKGGSKAELMSGYGMTELTSAATATFRDCCSKGSAGIPLVKVVCRIVDTEDGSEKRYGEEGEICFFGPTVMMEYYQNPEATAEMIEVKENGERWLHTGDLGHISENGEVFVTGRIKRICITRGEDGIAVKLFPDRIEKALYGVDSVRECCVFEKEDPQRVNVAIALVVMKRGKSFADELKKIEQELHEKLPAYMIPVTIKEVKSLPRTSRGKIDYLKAKESFLTT